MAPYCAHSVSPQRHTRVVRKSRRGLEGKIRGASMRIALLTEGGYPYARGESVVWCDRLVRGLSSHEFEVYALSRGRRQEEAGWVGPTGLPSQVRQVRTARLWGPPQPTVGRRETRGGATRAAELFAGHFTELAGALCAPCVGAARGESAESRHESPGQEVADRFANSLYGLAELAAGQGGLAAFLCSEEAVRILESACRAPGALRAVRGAQVADLLAVMERLERALRPLSLDWYGLRDRANGVPSAVPEEATSASAAGVDGAGGLAEVDLCHAVGGGLAALPGLLAKRSFGTPLLVTEYGVRLREHYLSSLAGLHGTRTPHVGTGVRTSGDVRPEGGTFAASAAVRSLMGSFQRQLAAEVYRQAEVITPGNSHARSWQEHCGADRNRLRTVYPGMDSSQFLTVAEDRGAAEEQPTLAWVGRVEPAKDVVGLLHAFAEIRRSAPTARLLLVETRTGAGEQEDAATGSSSDGTGQGGTESYASRCRDVAARLFSDREEGLAPGESPVSFVELGSPAMPTLAHAYANASVVLLSSVVEGFPRSLVEAMFCGRATVSTDAGAVCEVIGGTGLVVPPGNPRALADACLALLADPERRARLGAAARERAMELFTVEQNVTAFHGIYLELISRGLDHRAAGGGRPGRAAIKPFARTAESQSPLRLAHGEQSASGRAGKGAPSWARTVGAGGMRQGDGR